MFPDWLGFAGWLVGSPVLWEGNGVEARVILVVLRWLYGTFWMLDNTMSSCYVHFRLLLFFFLMGSFETHITEYIVLYLHLLYSHSK